MKAQHALYLKVITNKPFELLREIYTATKIPELYT